MGANWRRTDPAHGRQPIIQSSKQRMGPWCQYTTNGANAQDCARSDSTTRTTYLLKQWDQRPIDKFYQVGRLFGDELRSPILTEPRNVDDCWVTAVAEP